MLIKLGSKHYHPLTLRCSDLGRLLLQPLPPSTNRIGHIIKKRSAFVHVWWWVHQAPPRFLQTSPMVRATLSAYGAFIPFFKYFYQSVDNVFTWMLPFFLLWTSCSFLPGVQRNNASPALGFHLRRSVLSPPRRHHAIRLLFSTTLNWSLKPSFNCSLPKKKKQISDLFCLFCFFVEPCGLRLSQRSIRHTACGAGLFLGAVWGLHEAAGCSCA